MSMLETGDVQALDIWELSIRMPRALETELLYGETVSVF